MLQRVLPYPSADSLLVNVQNNVECLLKPQNQCWYITINSTPNLIQISLIFPLMSFFCSRIRPEYHITFNIFPFLIDLQIKVKQPSRFIGGKGQKQCGLLAVGWSQDLNLGGLFFAKRQSGLDAEGADSRIRQTWALGLAWVFCWGVVRSGIFHPTEPQFFICKMGS